MITVMQKIAPVFVAFLTLFFLESGVVTEYADAKSRMGGRMFSKPAPRKAPAQQNMNQTNQTTQQNTSGFGRGLAGGLLGGAIGAMLFGSLFGATGEGFGLLPILLLAGAAFFIFRKMSAAKALNASAAGGASGNVFTMPGGHASEQAEEAGQSFSLSPVEEGLREIRRTDPGFDAGYFVEVASDVFFQIQAGWMRRDLDSYKHLLGDTIAAEYDEHFAEMRQAGHINKLESIAIRRVEIVNAGSDGKEDFVTVVFSANLLDYIVDEKTGELVSGSMTEPVKFEEEWTWARPTGTQNWRLEGIGEASV
ncbi:MAG: Tim44 domain-containing protein [Desulfopila sp.]|jgi:predicted lipid-binding transport protein (Tim44 family)|nr:Tim44 domain-containing protein [Desulfopila sp.]